MRHLIFNLFFIFSLGCESNKKSQFILDVKSIVNKAPSETEYLLGKPDSTYTIRILGRPIYCQRYAKNNIEIQYPENQATDIVIYGPHGLAFNQSALKAFNIDYKTNHPDEYMKDRLIRWLDVDEFSTITFYDPELDSAGNIKSFTIFFKAKGIE